MNDLLGITIVLYIICWMLTAMINEDNDNLYNWDTKEDTIYSLLKILFAPFVFIPWALFAIGKEVVRAWMEKPDTRKDIKR